MLALNVPVIQGRKPEQIVAFYKEAMRRIAELPGVERVAVGTLVPWRDAGGFGRASSSRSRATESRWRRGSARALPHRLAGFFAALGVPLIAGRDFNEPTAVTPRRSSSSARAWRSGCSRIRMR